MPTNKRFVMQQIIIIYFLMFAARGLVLPFANLYLADVGFSGTVIGLLVSLSALLRLTLSPLMNIVADRTGRHRQLLTGLIMGNGSALFAMAATTNPLLLGGFVLLRDLTDRPRDPLLTQLTITWMERQGLSIFGRIRVWGSIGWGVVTMFSGRIFAAGGYALLFVLSAILSLGALVFVRVLPHQTTDSEEHNTTAAPREPGFYMLLVSLFLYAVGMTSTYTFMFIYFQYSLGASTGLIGVLAAVAALAEIPSMLFIDKLVRRVNILITLAVGILGMVMLWTAFALLVDTTLLIPLMILRGTFFTFQAVSIPLLVSRISHPNNVATNQSLALVTIPGLAVLLTGPVSGWIFDHLGAQTLFVLAGFAGVLSVLVLIATRRFLSVPARTAQANPPQPT